MTHKIAAQRIARLLAAGDVAGALAAASQLAQQCPEAASLRLLATTARRAGDQRTRFDALFRAGCELGDMRAGAELAEMLVHMHPSSGHPDVDRAWAAALRVPWDRPANLVAGALAYLEIDGRVSAALDRPGDSDAIDQAVDHLVDHPVFQALSSLAVICDARWASFLIHWRDWARRRWLDSQTADIEDCCWLALQANLCEYLWPVEGLQGELDRLHADLSSDSAARGAAVLLACHQHPGPVARSCFPDTEGPVALLAERLYLEPDLEAELARELAGGSAPDLPDTMVRTQYERHPYPRWVAEPLLPNILPEPVRARMKTRRFEKPKLLLAGCGTGQQCFAARATHPGARITAVDFSVASLVYAARKCRQANLSGVTFAAAELEAFAQRSFKFDLIECTGVLHHLPDLEAGASALRRLAMPGSLLRLAVYSATAREPVRLMRVALARSGLDDSMESLRLLHRQILAGEHGPLPPALLRSPDLYSAGGLHDLLFNACEHALGAQAWAELLDRHGFGWVCMDPPRSVLEFAAATSGPDVNSWGPTQWAAFEQRHPFAFGGMYEFWFVAR